MKRETAGVKKSKTLRSVPNGKPAPESPEAGDLASIVRQRPKAARRERPHHLRPPAQADVRPRGSRRHRLRARSVLPGSISVHARHPPDHVSRPAVDDAPVRRLRHRQADERTLSSSCSRRARPVFRSRSTCPRSWATTPIIRARSARSASAASRSRRSQDMQDLFDGIDLGKITTSMTINCTAPVALAMYIATAEAQGVPQEKLGGTLQTDMLKEYIAQKEWIYPPEPSMRIITDMIAYCSKNVPKWNTISISGYHIREAGIDRSARARLHARGRLRVRRSAVSRAGMDVDDFAPRLSFFFNSHSDFFEEIAKFRAARRIWARHMRERYGAKNPRSWTHALPHADGRLLGDRAAARQQHHAHRVPGAGRGARRHAIAAHELARRSARVADREERADRAAHAAGHRVRDGRRRTSSIRSAARTTSRSSPTRWKQAAEDYFRRIDELGGVIPAIHAGFFQKEIADASYRYQREIENGERIIVGVNEFIADEEQQIALLKIDRAMELEQCRARAGVPRRPRRRRGRSSARRRSSARPRPTRTSCRTTSTA